MTFKSSHISVSVNRSVKEVYDFIRNPSNLPLWAAGLSGSIVKEGNDWIADSPMGKVKVKFAADNSYGIVDHEVTLPSGIAINNPFRVIPNKKGSEIVFSLFQLEGMSDEQFKQDEAMVKKDLNKLKGILENI